MKSNRNMQNSWRGQKSARCGSILERGLFCMFLLPWSWMMMPLHGWLINEDAPKPIGSRRHCLLSRTNCESLLHLPPRRQLPHSLAQSETLSPCSISAKMNNACTSHTDCFARGLSGKFDWYSSKFLCPWRRSACVYPRDADDNCGRFR